MGQKISGELDCSHLAMTCHAVALPSLKGSSKRCRTAGGGGGCGGQGYGDEELKLAYESLSSLLLFCRPSRLDLLLDRKTSHDIDTQLAHAWNPMDRSPCIRVKKDDPMTFRRLPVQHTTDAIRGKMGYSRGLHAWNIRLKADHRGSHAVVGVATAEAPLRGFGYKCLVGSDSESWGWDIVKNKLWHDGKSSQGLVYSSIFSSSSSSISSSCSVYHPSFSSPSFSSSCPSAQADRMPSIPEEVTVILDMETGTMGFAFNDRYLGVAFRGLKGKILYPIVSAVWGNCEVTIRYIGTIEPNPSSLSESCRRVIRQTIGKRRLADGLQQLPLPPLLIKFLQ